VLKAGDQKREHVSHGLVTEQDVVVVDKTVLARDDHDSVSVLSSALLLLFLQQRI
jgi:hypothetical protein